MRSRDRSNAMFVSTGQLPPPGDVRRVVDDAYETYRHNREGEVSDVYPALQQVAPDAFGICVIGSNGRIIAVGDCDTEFSIMSVVKPFVFALICQTLGADALRAKIGVNSTGFPFNSLAAIERSGDGRTNPMVNSGAIGTVSLAPGATVEERWHFLLNGLIGFAGRKLTVMEDIYTSAMASNFRNRQIAATLSSFGRIYCDPDEAIDLYSRACSLGVTARDLALMGATLADGGVNPETGVAVVDPNVCRRTLAVMVTAGLYETSGDWLYETGLPGKSGIGGGIVTIAPGKGGMGTYAPRLDEIGNSVKGQLVARHLASELGLDILSSQPG